MVYIFWFLFFFPLLLSVDKRSTLAKICGGLQSPQPPLPPPDFYLPVMIYVLIYVLIYTINI